MEKSEIIAASIGALIGVILPRIFQKSDQQSDQKADLSVRQAVTDQKVSSHQDRIAILERDCKAVWREMDKLRGKL